jgi:murein DD-endopeptidase MepM/ murein hydrolase activator NlpD
LQGKSSFGFKPEPEVMRGTEDRASQELGRSRDQVATGMTKQKKIGFRKNAKIAGLAVVSAAVGAALALSLSGRVDQDSLLPLVDLEGAIVQEAAAFPAGPAPRLIENLALEQEETTRATVLRKITVSRGDTLIGLMVDAGITPQVAHKAIAALSEVFDPRGLRPGQEIFLTFTPQETASLLIQASTATATEEAGTAPADELVTLALRPSLEQDIRVTLQEDQSFLAEAIDRPLTRVLGTAEGSIESSLAVSAQEAGMPAASLVTAIRALSFDVDFQREIRKGDTYEFLYETFEDQDGLLARSGNLLYAAMTLSGELHELYYYEDRDGDGDYYTLKGESVRKALLRTPVDGARLSSGFGMRKHPVLGYNKMHRGTDFAAPRGTPVYAAGKGQVETAGRNGGYGNYVRIRHNSTYKTAYAHLNRIAKGITRGKTVKQGQIIGYVGTTGRSTGPHLHYEVLLNGAQVNPLSIKLPSGEKLSNEKLARFQIARAEIDQLRADHRSFSMVKADCRGAGSVPGPC